MHAALEASLHRTLQEHIRHCLCAHHAQKLWLRRVERQYWGSFPVMLGREPFATLSFRLQASNQTSTVHAQMKRAHKRAMEDRAYAQKSKGDIQVFPSPQSVLETTSFSGSDDHV